MTRPLVFGVTGQVARALRRRVPDGIFLSRAEVDLADPAACAAAVAHGAGAVDAVINAAAWTAVDAAEAEEDAARIVNAEAPGAMARAAAAAGLPFLHVSTDYVFDGTGNRPRQPDDAPAPLGAYGRTKLAGERAVAEAGGRSAVLRTSWVVSAEGANFVRTMLALSRTRERLTVVADQIGGPTPAGAIAAALLSMAGRLPEGQGVWHLSGAPDTSWAEFARAILAAAGRTTEVADIPASDWPTPAPRPANSRLDCGTLARDFGIGRPDWRAALGPMVAAIEAEAQRMG
ncbi:dTDP-4-dehydrorhamnose reductase [Wenxinia marina]|uniref:dTDP-4-dehydrorhamnose reductase n=1 Tax=Wenxinia marina TaxID=390641 RepID=UPI000476FD5B|nr:dTDP-4-dehydrorhamnose reductase [Wenxinia marina]